MYLYGTYFVFDYYWITLGLCLLIYHNLSQARTLIWYCKTSPIQNVYRDGARSENLGGQVVMGRTAAARHHPFSQNLGGPCHPASSIPGLESIHLLISWNLQKITLIWLATIIWLSRYRDHLWRPCQSIKNYLSFEEKLKQKFGGKFVFRVSLNLTFTYCNPQNGSLNHCVLAFPIEGQQQL